MWQTMIAVLLIVYFLGKLFWQKQAKAISTSEFYFWLVFWLVSLGLILGIKTIDNFVHSLGFSASGIEVLLYLAVAILFYFIFRVRLRLEKQEENITKLSEELALRHK